MGGKQKRQVIKLKQDAYKRRPQARNLVVNGEMNEGGAETEAKECG